MKPHTHLVQGRLSLEPNDPDFIGMSALWNTDSQPPLHSITETLLALSDESQNLHYFGHGFADSTHAAANFLEMDKYKLYTRLLPLVDINVGVVNLSACFGAASKNHLGLGQILVAGGAQSCIANLWRAEGLSLWLFNYFLQEASAGGTITQREFFIAQQKLRHVAFGEIKALVNTEHLRGYVNRLSGRPFRCRDDAQIFNHPFFWAGFVYLQRSGR